MTDAEATGTLPSQSSRSSPCRRCSILRAFRRTRRSACWPGEFGSAEGTVRHRNFRNTAYSRRRAPPMWRGHSCPRSATNNHSDFIEGRPKKTSAAVCRSFGATTCRLSGPMRARVPASQRRVPLCITIQNDDFTFGALAAGSSIPSVPDGWVARVRRAIRRTRHRRYDAPPANHALALDFAAAGFPERISRIRAAWARRPESTAGTASASRC